MSLREVAFHRTHAIKTNLDSANVLTRAFSILVHSVWTLLDGVTDRLNSGIPHSTNSTMKRSSLVTRFWHSRIVGETRRLLRPQMWYRRATAARRSLPVFFVAGAAKSGTTSLWAYLSEHPQVRAPWTKEMSFFDVNFARGFNWYRMHFPLNNPSDSSTVMMTGESSAYYMFHPLAPQRIAETLPGARIILLLRNPVDRAFSHYQMNFRRRNESLSFEDAIQAEPERLDGEHERILAAPNYYSFHHDKHSYLARGRYAEQIRVWQSLFPPERLLIEESSDLFRNTAEVFNRVVDFLGLPRWQPSAFTNRFPGQYRARMNESTRASLTEYFRPFNSQLSELLGREFPWDKSAGPK